MKRVEHPPSQLRHPRRPRRTGSLIVWCAFLLVVLIGMIGLVIDSGLMMAAHRQAQNAADAACMAAAYDLLQRRTTTEAQETGATFVTDSEYNNLPDATVAINIPPQLGPYEGMSNYAEAIVSTPNPTYFIHILPGVSQGYTVQARAVSGYELVPSIPGIIALDPDAAPGFKISGNGDVTVHGGVYVNSRYGGYDENGDEVDSDLGGEAAALSGNGDFRTSDFRVVGGVDHPNNYLNIDPDGPSPLHASQSPTPDPMIDLPPPTTATDPLNVHTTQYTDTDIGDDDPVTLYPGIYNKGIKIQSDADVTFEPGIYILRDGGLQISGDGYIMGHGVMFYNTGDDYNVTNGLPDKNDGEVLDNPTGSSFEQLNLGGNGTWDFTPLAAPNSPFDGMLFYQRRANDKKLNISGNADLTSFGGVVYAKWAHLYVSGNGYFESSFVVGRFEISGNGQTELGREDGSVGVEQVYLVE